MLESGDCLNRFCSAPVVSTVRLMRFMQLARSTLKTPKAADGPRDKTGQMPAHSPALLLLVARRDRYASWSCTSSSHPHAHLHAQLGRISIRRPIGGCHRSIVIGARPHALEELVARLLPRPPVIGSVETLPPTLPVYAVYAVRSLDTGLPLRRRSRMAVGTHARAIVP